MDFSLTHLLPCQHLYFIILNIFCRFYLVSDGVPLMIVGVTAAFGMDNYGSRDDAL